MDEYKRRWRAIENLTGLHVVTSSLHDKEKTVAIDGNVTSHCSITFKQGINYGSGENLEFEMTYATSSESFDDNDIEMSSEYSVGSSTMTISRGGSSHSMDHPYQHREQQQQSRKKLKNFPYSASETKLTSSKPSASTMGIYQKIEEDLEESNALQKSTTTPNAKRRLFKRSKGSFTSLY